VESGESQVKQGRWRRDKGLLTISLLGELSIYIPPALEDAPKKGCASSSPSYGGVDLAPPSYRSISSAGYRPQSPSPRGTPHHKHAKRVHVVLSREGGLPVWVLVLPRDRAPGFYQNPDVDWGPQ
jgi:hypothetical protein